MDKKLLSTVLALCAILMISGSFLFYFSRNQEVNQGITNPSSPSQTENSGYIIKAYQKKIAIFRLPEQEPLEIFDVYLDSLPDLEQEELKKGIYAKDLETLHQLVEDYTS